MKVGVIGSRGWIGTMIQKELASKSIESCDILERSESPTIRDTIESLSLTHIVYVAGRTHGTRNGTVYTTIDYLESNETLGENVRDNLFGPIKIALICQSLGIHMSYVGTGCIFTYTTEDQKDIFTEDSYPNFFGSNYSVVKGYTDSLMKEIPSVLQWRIRMPITSNDHPRNFISKIIRYEKICSVPNSMTVLDDIVPIMVQMMCDKKVGTWNMTNPGRISHNEVLQMYKDIVDPSFTWKNFTEAEQSEILLSGRSNNELDSTQLSTAYSILPVRESVEQALRRWTTNQ